MVDGNQESATTRTMNSFSQFVVFGNLFEVETIVAIDAMAVIGEQFLRNLEPLMSRAFSRDIVTAWAKRRIDKVGPNTDLIERALQSVLEMFA